MTFKTLIFWAALIAAQSILGQGTTESGMPYTMDSDSNCYFIPASMSELPCLVYLSCTGGKPEYIDSVRMVWDSLGWAIAVSGPSRNHRDPRLNEMDILRLIARLDANDRIDMERVFLWGFSGQGAQALGTSLRNPDLIRGAITACAHLGIVSDLDPKASKQQAFYIITREEDWNRQHNEILHAKLLEYHIADSLHMTEGEHGIGSHYEVYEGARFFDNIIPPGF